MLTKYEFDPEKEGKMTKEKKKQKKSEQKHSDCGSLQQS